jgi:hypothetical protein
MKNRLKLLLAFSGVLLLANQVKAQFSGDFTPTNWSIINTDVSSSASVDVSGAPASIVFTGNDSGAGGCCGLYDDYQITLPPACQDSVTLSFTYDFIQPDIEAFYYVVDGVTTFVTDMTETGTLTVNIANASTFAFRIYTDDDCCGAGVLTISNLVYYTQDITAPLPDILSLTEITADCTVDLILEPTASDACEGTIFGTTTTTFPITTVGTTVITWTYDDMNGNITTQDQLVTISNNLNLSASVTIESAGSDGAIDVTTLGGAGAVMYDWDNDGLGDNDDTEDLTGLTTGNYMLIATDGGCVDTLTIVVEHLSLLENEFVYEVSPNPTTGTILIQLDNNKVQSIQLVNSLGQVVSEETIVSDFMTIDLTGLTNGIYFLRGFNSTEELFSVKVSKQ